MHNEYGIGLNQWLYLLEKLPKNNVKLDVAA